jgi:hypothetical protein
MRWLAKLVSLAEHGKNSTGLALRWLIGFTCDG